VPGTGNRPIGGGDHSRRLQNDPVSPIRSNSASVSSGVITAPRGTLLGVHRSARG
jgi:hypothetical protein